MSRAGLASKVSELWQGLLDPGMGSKSSSSCPSSETVAADEAPPRPPPPLQRQLAAVGIAAADMSQGRRPALSGFVIAVAALLQAHAVDGHASGILQQRLEVEIQFNNTPALPRQSARYLSPLYLLQDLFNTLICFSSSSLAS